MKKHGNFIEPIRNLNTGYWQSLLILTTNFIEPIRN